MRCPVRGVPSLAPVSLIRVSATVLAAALTHGLAIPAHAQEATPEYTQAQAAAGQALYNDACARCHGSDLSDGSAPPLVGPTFRRTWSRPNVNVADLLYVMETTMPPRQVRWKYHSADAMVGAVTATAGGLIFAGEVTGDFIALSADSGEVLYRFNTGGPIGGGLVSYGVDGRQYVAVASGRPSPFWWGENTGSGTIVVFALPEGR